METTWRGLTPFGHPAAGKKKKKERGIERATHPRLSFGRRLARSAVFARGKPGGARNPISRMCAGLTRLSHVRLRDLLIAGCTTSPPLIGRLIVSRFRCLFRLFDLSCPRTSPSPSFSFPLFFFSSLLFVPLSLSLLQVFVASPRHVATAESDISAGCDGYFFR